MNQPPLRGVDQRGEHGGINRRGCATRLLGAGHVARLRSSLATIADGTGSEQFTGHAAQRGRCTFATDSRNQHADRCGRAFG